MMRSIRWYQIERGTVLYYVWLIVLAATVMLPYTAWVYVRYRPRENTEADLKLAVAGAVVGLFVLTVDVTIDGELSDVGMVMGIVATVVIPVWSAVLVVAATVIATVLMHRGRHVPGVRYPRDSACLLVDTDRLGDGAERHGND